MAAGPRRLCQRGERAPQIPAALRDCEWEHELLVLESVPRISLAYWGTHVVCRWERAELFS